MGAKDWLEDDELYVIDFESRHPDIRQHTWYAFQKPHIWKTAKGKEIHVDQMSEQHVRNTLKVILRRAHEGKVWAAPKSGPGLRYYDKGDPHVASIKVKPAVPKITNPWDNVEQHTLTMTKKESQVVTALIKAAADSNAPNQELIDLYNAIGGELIEANPVQARSPFGVIVVTE